MAYEYPYTGAYNPYTAGAGYQPYSATGVAPRPYMGNYGVNSTMQPTAMQPQQIPPQPQPQQSNVPWIQVPNIEAARNVMVQPNQTAYMMNQNAPEFYVKSTDQMGVATLRCFAFQEFNPTEQAAKEVLSAQADKLVSREEFNNYAQAVNAQFNAIQQVLCSTSGQTTQPQQTVQPAVLPQAPTQTEQPAIAQPAPTTSPKKKVADK